VTGKKRFGAAAGETTGLRSGPAAAAAARRFWFGHRKIFLARGLRNGANIRRCASFACGRSEVQGLAVRKLVEQNGN
jgi:hypothetical protein